jgi:hypothetical protein
MMETAEVLELPVAVSVEGMAHQFVVMSMFGRVVGTEVGLQREAEEDIVGDVFFLLERGLFCFACEVLLRVRRGVRRCGEKMPRLRWSFLRTGLDVINVEAVAKGCSSEREEQDLSQGGRFVGKVLEIGPGRTRQLT